MARKRYTTEQIIGLLRQAEVRLGGGQTIGSIRRGNGITEESYDRWRREYGGLKLDQAKRLKELERENDRLKKAVSELTLDKLILTVKSADFPLSAQLSVLPVTSACRQLTPQKRSQLEPDAD
jgi:transposase-like protein